jgi:hypothetical protein
VAEDPRPALLGPQDRQRLEQVAEEPALESQAGAQYEAAVRKVPVERLTQLASAPEGPLVEMNCADNPNSYFPGTSALPIPQAVVPDF